jgi:signal transduction histidine kinase
MIERAPVTGDASDDLRRGLNVIGGRADALSRFMSSYARLARLPAPKRQDVAVGPWVRRVAAFETRLPIEVRDGPEISIKADGDQLDQVLINLVRNAADAALTTGGGVEIDWVVDEGTIEVRVRDDGPGLPSTSNLFVPFFTTKPDGSGIGLVLSRQIVEAHGGMLTLENRAVGRGCVARLRLPRGERSQETTASRAAS